VGKNLSVLDIFFMGWIMDLQLTAGCQISILIFEKKIVEEGSL
jgi:hypothetical protein